MFRSLAREYGWTPDDVGAMTPEQVFWYTQADEGEGPIDEALAAKFMLAHRRAVAKREQQERGKRRKRKRKRKGKR